MENYMNNKMKKFAFKDVANIRNAKIAPEVLISSRARLDKNSKVSFIFELSLSPRLMSLAGWKASDSITFEYDEGVILMRIDDVGRKIYGGNKKGTRYRLRYSLPKEYFGLFVEKSASEIEVDQSAVCFKLV
jgi:hypothetical protein